MKQIPFRNCDIKNPDLLFGRTEELNILCDHAERLDQVQLLGARRFGKTCVLLTLTEILKSRDTSNVFPIYLDLSSDRIKGTIEVYKYIASKIISSLFDNWFHDEIIRFSHIDITPDSSWRKVYNQLNSISDITVVVDAFEEFVTDYSELLEHTFLLLFDEYEYMASKAFDEIGGFMSFREISNRPNAPISFWLCGARPWREFVYNNKTAIGGSGEFNGVTITRYLRPIDYESFKAMWKLECDLISNEDKRGDMESKCDMVYKSSGGIPFYAKSIGGKLCVDSDFPDFSFFQDHFVELEKLLSDKELRLLSDIQRTPKSLQEPLPPSAKNLLLYGIIRKNSNSKYYIPFELFAQYIKAKIFEQRPASTANKVDGFVNRIFDLIYTINENNRRIKGEFMFDPSNDRHLHDRHLRTLCTNRECFSNFIGSVYLIYWEGSKRRRGGDKLPDRFRETIFQKALDRLRHTFGNAHQTDKLEKSNKQISKGDALLEITGSDSEPQAMHDWLHLQECLLSRFCEELEEISKYLTTNNRRRR